MRSLLILATLALVCFVDKNSAAAVRRDGGSSIDNAGSPIDAQTDVRKNYNPAANLDDTLADYSVSAADKPLSTGVTDAAPQ